MLSLPFIAFWILIIIGRSELGFKGVIFCILLWFGLLVGFFTLGISPYWFITAQALFDAILVVVIFGGDIRIR
jgi:hypothetical protein